MSNLAYVHSLTIPAQPPVLAIESLVGHTFFSQLVTRTWLPSITGNGQKPRSPIFFRDGYPEMVTVHNW
jgi:hypothetical protein